MMWEYDVTEKPRAGMGVGPSLVPDLWRDHMNERGAQGWELAAADGPYLLWKRPVTPIGLESA